jgi:mRNA interferase RelE/StbE
VAEYDIVLARSAEKELFRLPMMVSSRAHQAIDRLAINPRPPGCKKLKQGRRRWRIRVGDYRILYTINDAQHIVDIEAVRHRREAYG